MDVSFECKKAATELTHYLWDVAAWSVVSSTEFVQPIKTFDACQVADAENTRDNGDKRFQSAKGEEVDSRVALERAGVTLENLASSEKPVGRRYAPNGRWKLRARSARETDVG